MATMSTCSINFPLTWRSALGELPVACPMSPWVAVPDTSVVSMWVAATRSWSGFEASSVSLEVPDECGREWAFASFPGRGSTSLPLKLLEKDPLQSQRSESVVSVVFTEVSVQCGSFWGLGLLGRGTAAAYGVSCFFEPHVGRFKRSILTETVRVWAGCSRGQLNKTRPASFCFIGRSHEHGSTQPGATAPVVDTNSFNLGAQRPLS